MHAALAEPHRLAIVDALALGDLSPTELGHRARQQSSLLAHHLGVLEAAGVVSRHRSEGDRRRSYLTLAWDNPIVAATVTHALAPHGTRVVFVCSANSARSHMAASLLAHHTRFPVASAGTAPAHAIHPLAVAELERHGLAPLTSAPASASDVVVPSDIVVAVCDNAYEELGPDAVDLHWSIPDPARAASGSFSRAFADLTPRVERLADALTPGKGR